MPPTLLARYEEAKALDPKNHSSGGWLSNAWKKGVTGSIDPKKAMKLYKETAQGFMEIDDLVHAGPAYEAAAILEKDDWDAYQLFDAAYHAYHGTRPDDAARCLQELIRFYTKDGNYRSAAPKQEMLADLYAEKSQDYDKAIEAWQKAGNWYKNNQSAAMAAKNYKKAGEVCAKRGDYYKAIEFYEWCADNNPGAQSPIYCFEAGMCHIGTEDFVAFCRAVKHYDELTSSFANSREGRFLFDLTQAMEANDPEQYSLHCTRYNDALRIPDWKVSIFVKGLQKLKGGEDDFS